MSTSFSLLRVYTPIRRTSMNALLAFLLSVGGSLLSCTLIMVWYIVPRLAKQPRLQALLPLVLLHTFRTAGLEAVRKGLESRLERIGLEREMWYNRGKRRKKQWK